MATIKGHHDEKKSTINLDHDEKKSSTNLEVPHFKVDRQIVEEYTMSPEMMETIKTAIMVKLKDHNFLKETIVEFITKNPDVVTDIRDEIHTVNTEEIVLRQIDKMTAKKEIHQYIKDNPRCLTSEIIENLKIDPVMVGEILKELSEENAIE